MFVNYTYGISVTVADIFASSSSINTFDLGLGMLVCILNSNIEIKSVHLAHFLQYKCGVVLFTVAACLGRNGFSKSSIL